MLRRPPRSTRTDTLFPDPTLFRSGGIGIAPGANLSDTVAMFEATHGTAPKYAGQDKVNPGSLILSAEMMLRHMGWVEAADLIIKSTESATAAKRSAERRVGNEGVITC